MKFSTVLKLSLFIFFISNIYCQNTYFIKYKNTVNKEQIGQKISQQKLTVSDAGLSKTGNIKSINYFARGLGRNDETLSQIVKVTFDNSVSESDVLNLQISDPSIEYIEKSSVFKKSRLLTPGI